jgi:hypothetical protein
MIDYDKIREINKNTTRIRRSAGVTADNSSFVYESNGRFVKKGIHYHIHYTKDLKEFYMTGKYHTKFSRLIKPINPELESDFKKYVDSILGNYTPLYRKPMRNHPQAKDYNNGYFIRYFAKKANDPEVPVFEVDSNFSTPAYDIYQIRWQISGTPEAVFFVNRKASDILSLRIPSVKKILTNYREFLILPSLSETVKIQEELGVLNLKRDKDGNKVFVDQPIKKPLNMKMRKGSNFGKGGIKNFKINPKFFNK